MPGNVMLFWKLLLSAAGGTRVSLHLWGHLGLHWPFPNIESSNEIRDNTSYTIDFQLIDMNLILYRTTKM
jgi:hypothetical protein